MDSNKIPKIIHYCWFGEKEKPSIVNKCISSWKEKLSDYEFREWNENTFNINSNSFIKEAYERGKYAFVSDYVRVYALYNYGGIYLDTDVEVKKSFNDLLDNDSIWGFEEKNFIATSTIGACKANKLIKQFLDSYDGKRFVKEDGTIDTLTNVAVVSNLVKSLGVKLDGSYQKIEGIATFYPQDYFSPYDYINCYMKDSSNTYAIHYYHKSWLPMNARIKTSMKKLISNVIGGQNLAKIREIANKN